MNQDAGGSRNPGGSPAAYPGGALARAINAVCIAMIRGYQRTLAVLLGGHCRFHPTCSNYAIEAYQVWGPWRGTWLTLRRLARCHPFGGHGFDPVPERRPPRHEPNK